MNIYEFEFSIYVEAEDKRDAGEKVREISKLLDALDVEGQSERKGPDELTPTQVYGIEQRQKQSK